MKKIIALLLILCMVFPVIGVAEEERPARVYVFGDNRAYAWGQELVKFAFDENVIVNAAGNGALLSGITKIAEFNQVKKGDTVILSYGILERDRPGDKNAEFAKNLNEIVEGLKKKGARVIFASICSSMRYNTLTGRMEETKNFYTETMRNYAKKNSITYIDLSSLTASWANRLGSGQATRLYKSFLALTESGNKMCAYTVFTYLNESEELKGRLKADLGRVYKVEAGETSKAVDVFFEEDLTDSFVIYVKNGFNVSINSQSVPSGDSSTVCTSVGGRINVNFSSCEAIEVVPVFRLEANGAATTQMPFEGKVFPGVYDVRVKKTEPLKASVYLNGYLIASNLDMPGTQAVVEAAEHTFREYTLTEGEVKVNVTGLTDKLDYISFAQSATIFDKKPRIFVGGDSTVCNYYPLERSGNEADGTVMTGWAMLLDKYADAHVVNLAASGDWASKWKKSSFNIIEKEGRRGDLFIIQFGINDRYNSTIEEMVTSLSEMIDTSWEKGMIPVLVSPQISAGYGWGEEGEMGKSDGGAYVEYFDAVRTLSEEKGCFYVDLTDLSSGWFSEIGRDAVYKKYHLWDYENNKPKDMMHLSYKGADAMCSFFVLGLKKISDAKLADAKGNTLENLKFW